MRWPSNFVPQNFKKEKKILALNLILSFFFFFLTYLFFRLFIHSFIHSKKNKRKSRHLRIVPVGAGVVWPWEWGVRARRHLLIVCYYFLLLSPYTKNKQTNCLCLFSKRKQNFRPLSILRSKKKSNSFSGILLPYEH